MLPEFRKRHCETPLKTPRAHPLFDEARRHFARGELDAAARTVAALLADDPDCLPYLTLASMVALARSRHMDAAGYFEQAVALAPTEANLYAGLGAALYELGQTEKAIDALRHACELAPGVAANWFNLGRALKLQVQSKQAADALRRAIELDPVHFGARLTLAGVESSTGDVQAAAARLQALVRDRPNSAQAWFALANLKVVRLGRAEAETLQHNYLDKSATPEDRILFGFSLARALEDLGNYDASFAVLTQANQLKRGQVQWDRSAHRAYVAAMKDVFASPVDGAPHGTLGESAIFIASVPRSGSTLVEQILASHPEVTGANEIDAAESILNEIPRRQGMGFPTNLAHLAAGEWNQLGLAYLAKTERWRKHTRMFTDKSLGNWSRIGAILTMLPKARVILVHRDAVETCLSCYRQYFFRGAPFSYDLDDLASYYADFRDMKEFWLKRFPDRVMDFRYEDLIAAPAHSVRQLLGFCDLPYDQACLEFHGTARTVTSDASAAQVRQPLDRNTARAGRYGAALDHLRNGLDEHGCL